MSYQPQNENLSFLNYIYSEIKKLWKFCSYENILVINILLCIVWILTALFEPNRILKLTYLNTDPHILLVYMFLFFTFSISTLLSIHKSLFLSAFNYLLICMTWLCFGVAVSFDVNAYFDNIIFYYAVSIGGIWGFIRSIKNGTRL